MRKARLENVRERVSKEVYRVAFNVFYYNNYEMESIFPEVPVFANYFAKCIFGHVKASSRLRPLTQLS